MNIIKKGDRVQTVTDTECNRAERRRKTMKFKKGDRVEVIWRSELHQGLVEEVIELTDELTDELMVKLAKKPAIDYLFKQNQVSKVELVKVPKFVADWIEYCEKHRWGLSEALEDTYENSCMPEEVTDWLADCHENQELFARAWMGDYEVEEPLYYVRFFDGGLGFLNVYFNGVRLLNCHLRSEGYKTKFTEKEIKELDERYWSFAVPVEEVEETK
ncbi:DUF1642 domain-containing protein [Listeria monocytogenes]|uniref:DUF1642 domain-containing protein n=2 Tax=Listeria monocytogenes TaxID=1639 RepID=UPI0017762449|nr:DUF1642 domain-containing protein [Listeria monocytogenes]EAH0753974.1 DUF1642 domain-containing protein [Listeria monocytogenes]EJC5222346.1 DUF1642 domain-containing protein [Listeria monocytogenes]EJD7886043.1 DUF1642 domain-containing protein [Listeria monocytogenes]MBK3697143.1 DUF1642 domain-containing protein [Listeria monocytogenes]HAC3930995.1 DUF1642 domain-containing protein [Listeria monocytogenes]